MLKPKYRIWLKPKKSDEPRMLEVFSIDWRDGEIVNIEAKVPGTKPEVSGWWEFTKENIPLNIDELLVSTNLLDQNSKEIFTGDIVEHPRYGSDVVYYEYGSFHPFMDTELRHRWLASECIIIGNKFEGKKSKKSKEE